MQEKRPLTDTLQTRIQPLKATELLRMATPCAKQKCTHFDGNQCRLIDTVVDRLPPVVNRLPACQIRSSCRWWHQQGQEACLRCPQVITEAPENKL